MVDLTVPFVLLPWLKGNQGKMLGVLCVDATGEQ